MVGCVKHRIAKRISCFFLAFLLAIPFSIPAHATSVAPAVGSDLIGMEEFIANAETLVRTLYYQ